jgi:hypothetical protein
MKQCSRCGKIYSDDLLNFCLDDGELLSVSLQADQPEADTPTAILSDVRRTNPTNWPSTSTPGRIGSWQGQRANIQGQYTGYPFVTPSSQTLAVVSLGLGVASVTVGWCCSTGMVLGPAAIITGFLALSFIKNDPQKYRGRGFAIAGIATGAVYLALIVLFVLIYGVAIITGGLSGIN